MTENLSTLVDGVLDRDDGLGLRNLIPVGSGIGAAVFSAETRDGGRVAVKVPWHRWRPNHNDGLVDARWYLRRECEIYRYVAARGIPGPEVVREHYGDDGVDFVVCSYLDHDNSQVGGEELGRLLGHIHALPLSEEFRQRVCRPSMADVIVDRLQRRVITLEEVAGLRVGLPEDAVLRRCLEVPEVSLLHLDVRPVNVLARAGCLVGVIDWDNAIVGHPELEIVRMQIFGEFSEVESRAITAYREVTGPCTAPPELLTLFELDTSVMLAILFTATAPDANRASTEVTRLRALQPVVDSLGC